MATYSTGNPLGSTDPKDLYDNAQAFDSAVNSTSDTFQDRFGESRPTLKYLESEYPQSTQNALAALQARNEAEGFALSAEQDADRAEGFALSAEQDADRAEAAATAAYSSGNQFDGTASGLAATVDGQYFLVRTADPQVFNVYLNDGGAAVASGQFEVSSNAADKFSPILTVVTSGNGTSQTGSIPSYAKYSNGDIFWWIPTASSTGPMTLDINGLGPLTAVFRVDEPIRGGEIRSGFAYLIRISTAGDGRALVLTGSQAEHNPSPLMTVSSTGDGTTQTASVALYTEYRIRDTLLWSPSATNSGAVTLNINALGAVPVVKTRQVELESGDVKAGRLYLIHLTGSLADMYFRIVGAVASDAPRLESASDATAQSLQASNPNLFTENQVAGLDTEGMTGGGINPGQHNGVSCWEVNGSVRRWGLFRRADINGDTLSAVVRILDWEGSLDNSASIRFLLIQYSSPSSQTGEVSRQEVLMSPSDYAPGFLRIENMPIHEDCQSIGFFIGNSGPAGGTVKHRDMLLCAGGDATFRVAPSAPSAPSAVSREVWVSPDGNNNGSGSASLPFATLARAVAELDGRGTIYLAAGSYDGQQINAYNVRDLKIVGGADSDFNRSMFRYGTQLSLSVVSGRTGVFSAPLTRTVSWLWVDGIADEQTLVPYNEQHSLLNGRAHRLECTKVWHIPADNLGDALDLIEMSATPVCWRDTSTNTVYLSLPDGADINSEVYGAFDDIGLFSSSRPVWTPEAHIELVGIDIRYGHINTKSFRTSSLTDVRVVGAGHDGFDIGNWAELSLCSAGGSGSGGGLGDGFNAHNHAIWTFRDCYSHDNWDDGESSHQNCKVTGWGNIMEYNGGSGFTPALGAQEILHNCLSRKNATTAFQTGNKMGGFQVAGNPTETDPGVITSLEAYNCVSIGDRNGFYDGTASAAPAQRRLLAVNCKVFDAEETAFACAEIRDCSESGSGQAKSSGTTVTNTTLIV